MATYKEWITDDKKPSFYLRHPRGWRRNDDRKLIEVVASFYPRHPRGWRRAGHAWINGVLYVSIHATLAGGDIDYNRPSAAQRCFYPRHPRGWRPARFRAQASRKNVSIHATLAGGDRKGGHDHIHGLVSIHATLAGGDGGVPSLLPVRRRVSIHATLAGGDEVEVKMFCTEFWFLSTPPSRVATTIQKAREFLVEMVSIHATLAGGDQD